MTEGETTPVTLPSSKKADSKQVTDYLLKRGFTQTEEIFRKESANLGPDGRPIHTKVEEMGARKFGEAFILLRDWIENGLDVYKVGQERPNTVESTDNFVVRA